MSGEIGVLNNGVYYASVYRTDKGRDHPSLPKPSTIMNAPNFTPAAVHKELSTLDTAKGSGPDDLHPFMLQILADFEAEPITALYNKYLHSGEVPQNWRKEIICSIFKNGDPEDAANYRPVRLNPIPDFSLRLSREFGVLNNGYWLSEQTTVLS